MKLIHIIAGLLALAAGATALYATKGSTLHRKSGMIFVITMLVMSSTGAVMAVLKPTRISVIAAVLTFYLVSTALLTIRRPVEQARGLVTGFMLMALTVGAYGVGLGFEALNSVNGKLEGIPPLLYFAFAAFALLGGSLDARMLLSGSIQGAHRLARHLWRMSLAMFIATMSFFLGQAKLFPEPVRESGVLAIPVVLVLLTMLYWLVRVFLKRRSAAAVEPR